VPGDPAFYMAPGTFTDSGMSGASGAAPSSTHWGFILWLVVLGVVVPVAILGGLSVGGFSFVFRHR
jgi:hypothetical protein